MWIIIVQDTLPGFPAHTLPPVDVPAARRRRNPNPSPPHGGGGPQPAGGRRPQAARHQTPSPGRHRAASPGRWEGCGAGGLWPPERRPGPAQREPRAGPRQGGRPHPAAGPLGAPAGEVGLGAGGARAQARPPTPRQGGHSQRPGHRPPRQSAPAGGCGPRTQAASNETGRRPTTGRAPRRQPPAHTNGGEGARAGAGQGRAAAMGRGRPGRASTGPACTRPAAYLSGPARHLRGAGWPPPRGGPGRRALLRPRQRAGRGAPGRPHTDTV